MSKSIYNEVLEILLDSFKDPQDEDNDCFMFNFRQIIKIEKAILIAQDQEKLLGLYRQLVKDLGLVIEHDTTDTWDGPEDYEYLEIDYDSIKALNTYKQIKELEKEKENE